MPAITTIYPATSAQASSISSVQAAIAQATAAIADLEAAMAAAEEASTALNAIPSIAASYVRTIHADAYNTFTEAVADLEVDNRLLVRGGKTYTHSSGQLATWPARFCIESDNGLPATIDFSGNSAWQPTGLLLFEGALNAATETALTGDVIADNAGYLILQSTSATAIGPTVTMNFTTNHNLTTGDLVFIRAGSSMTDGQTPYTTEMPSDEGQALHKPVAVTVTSATQITYTAIQGTPDPTMTIFPYVYRNNQFLPMASTSNFARGDLVQVTTEDTYSGYTGSQTIKEAELNRVAFIITNVGLVLTHPVEFTYKVSSQAKVTKVDAKSPVLRNITIKGKGYQPGKSTYATSDTGIYEFLTDNAYYENVRFDDCDFISHCSHSTYYSTLQKCVSVKDERDAAGRVTGKIETNYGFAYGNSTRGYRAIDCVATGGRHGFDEYSSGALRGRIADFTLVRPVAINQWSYNIDTHDMYKSGKIIAPYVDGGFGILARNGGISITDAVLKNCIYGVRLTGRVVDALISVADAENIAEAVIYLSPSGTSTPDMRNIHVPVLRAKNVGYGLRADLPASSSGTFNFGNVSIDGCRASALYVSNGAGAVMRAVRGGSVHSINHQGGFVVYMDDCIDTSIDAVYGETTGNLTLVYQLGSSQARNTFGRVNGYSSGGSITPYGYGAGTHPDAPVTKTANFTLALSERIIINNKSGSPCTATLPAASGHAGRTFRIVNAQAQAVVASSSVVVPLNGGSAGTAILPPVIGAWADVTSDDTNWRIVAANAPLVGTASYDPASLADGAGATTTVTVTGAALGDFAKATFSADLQGIMFTAWVSAADTVSVRFQNETGGAIDLGSGTIIARVEK